VVGRGVLRKALAGSKRVATNHAPLKERAWLAAGVTVRDGSYTQLSGGQHGQLAPVGGAAWRTRQ
jgi:hypothetical protein